MPSRRRDHHALPTFWRRVASLIVLLVVAQCLSGCLLMSGAQQSSDRSPDGGGNVSVQFVSAEGTELRQVAATTVQAQLLVTVFARAERGQLRIEVLDPNGSAVLVVEGTPDEQVSRATVPTDAQGNLHFRIRATGAQRGAFQLLYQPAGS